MREAIAGMAVGGDAADIMRRFLDGWNQAQSLADIATAMADNAEVAAAIGPVTTARSISIATDLYDTYGDLDDILSTTQLDTLERLRLHPDSSDGRSPAIRPPYRRPSARPICNRLIDCPVIDPHPGLDDERPALVTSSGRS